MLGVWDLLDRLDEGEKEGLINMKLSEIKNGNLSAEWAEKGYELPKFDIEAVKAKTHAEPTWCTSAQAISSVHSRLPS